MNFQREKQLWFEVLKGVKVEDKVEHKGETITIKQVLQKVEVNQKGFFLELRKGLENIRMIC